MKHNISRLRPLRRVTGANITAAFSANQNSLNILEHHSQPSNSNLPFSKSNRVAELRARLSNSNWRTAFPPSSSSQLPRYVQYQYDARRWYSKQSNDVSVAKDSKSGAGDQVGAVTESNVGEDETEIMQPDHVLIRDQDARELFHLTDKDLRKLPKVTKKDPFADTKEGHTVDESDTRFTYFWLPDIIHTAMRLKDKKDVMTSYRDYLSSLKKRDIRARIHAHPPSQRKRSSIRIPATETDTAARRSVKTGLLMNSVIAAAKGGVWIFTGSSAIFADFMHSFADSVNYLYRLVGMRERGKDIDHPYGYGRQRYLFADRSFSTLFALGCAVPAYHAMSEIFWNQNSSTEIGNHLVVAEPKYAAISAAVFGMAFVAESYTLSVAAGAMNKQANILGVTLWEYATSKTRDIMTLAVFLEALIGVTGSCVGGLGVYLSYVYQAPLCDAYASFVMASIVGTGALHLMGRTSKFLIGGSLSADRIQGISNLLEQDPVVVAVYDVKTELFGETEARFKAEIAFNAEEITRQRFENRQLKFCHVE